MLLTLRCVDPQDKAMALGLISFAIGLFGEFFNSCTHCDYYKFNVSTGNVPCPILYGAVVDSACLFWEHSCGQLGACRVYDPSKFRTVFHGVTAIIMFIAFLVDAVVWYKASSIKFLQDEEETGDPHQPVSHDSNPIKSPSHDSNVNSLQLKTNDESVVWWWHYDCWSFSTTKSTKNKGYVLKLIYLEWLEWCVIKRCHVLWYLGIRVVSPSWIEF